MQSLPPDRSFLRVLACLLALLCLPLFGARSGRISTASASTKHGSAARHATNGHKRRYVIVLDPGHGGVMHYGDESGAVSPDGSLLEKVLTLKVALQAATDLRTMGYAVYLTRTRDRSVNSPPRDWNHDGKINHVDEFNARTAFANAHHADAFVSIHFDGSTDPSMHGTHGYYCPARPFWRSSRRLADLITHSVATSLSRGGYADPNNGVQTDVADVVPQERADYPWFLVLGPSVRHYVNASNMPGALIETLYLSSPRDDSAMHREVLIKAVARGYAVALKDYFHGRTHH
ncbi:MAG: N-acetylmuramoyl-L-alanine amidase family protein [Chloroflexota bacterium]